MSDDPKWKNVTTGAKYGLGNVVHEVTEEAQLLKLEDLVARIRRDPETSYENLQKLERLVKHLLQTWNNPPSA